MTTFLTHASDLDVRLEPVSDAAADRRESALSSVANPRRTTWTGYAKADRDRMPAC